MISRQWLGLSLSEDSMYQLWLNISSILNDCGQWLALVVGGFALARAHRRIGALERRLHREQSGVTVVTWNQPPPTTTTQTYAQRVIQRYMGAGR
jgi:hypothetical protein